MFTVQTSFGWWLFYTVAYNLLRIAACLQSLGLFGPVTFLHSASLLAQQPSLRSSGLHGLVYSSSLICTVQAHMGKYSGSLIYTVQEPMDW